METLIRIFVSEWAEWSRLNGFDRMAWLWLVTAMLQLRTMKWLNYWWWRDSKLRLSQCWSGAGAATMSRPTLVVESSAMTAIMETTSTGRKTKTINPNMLIGMAISLFNAYCLCRYLISMNVNQVFNHWKILRILHLNMCKVDWYGGILVLPIWCSGYW